MSKPSKINHPIADILQKMDIPDVITLDLVPIIGDPQWAASVDFVDVQSMAFVLGITSALTFIEEQTAEITRANIEKLQLQDVDDTIELDFDGGEEVDEEYQPSY